MTEAEIRKFEEDLKSAPLTPLSGRFFEAVRARMAEEDVALSEDDAEIEAALRALTPRALSEAFFRRTAEALGESGNGGNTLDFPKRFRAFPRWISAAAAAGVVAAGVAFWRLPETEAPNYELVSTENVLRNIEELPVELNADGELVRPIRYIYTNAQRWRDPKTQKTYVEYRPFENTVPTLVAVY